LAHALVETPYDDNGSSDVQRTYSEAMRKGVFPHEGGYTNDKADPGGPTNWGITIIDARLYWKKDASAADVKAMPKDVAEEIYRKHYATPLRYNDLPAGVDYSIMDYGVNSGIGRAGKVLRRLVGLPDNTSAITDDVIAAVNKRDPIALVQAINAERLAFLKTAQDMAGVRRRVGQAGGRGPHALHPFRAGASDRHHDHHQSSRHRQPAARSGARQRRGARAEGRKERGGGYGRCRQHGRGCLGLSPPCARRRGRLWCCHRDRWRVLPHQQMARKAATRGDARHPAGA
jgi:hypothetical protein